jgi:hypothetical protein
MLTPREHAWDCLMDRMLAKREHGTRHTNPTRERGIFFVWAQSATKSPRSRVGLVYAS